MRRPTQGNRFGTLEAVARARGRFGDLHQLGFSGLQQVLAFAGPLLGLQRVAAHDEPLIGERLTGQLQQVALVKQRGLERPLLLGERAHLRRAQAAHPVQPRRAQYRVNARLREHAAVAHPGDLADAIAVPQFLHLRGHGSRIGGVAGKHLDGHGTALRSANQTKHDLRISTDADSGYLRS